MFSTEWLPKCKAHNVDTITINPTWWKSARMSHKMEMETNAVTFIYVPTLYFACFPNQAFICHISFPVSQLILSNLLITKMNQKFFFYWKFVPTIIDNIGVFCLGYLCSRTDLEAWWVWTQDSLFSLKMTCSISYRDLLLFTNYLRINNWLDSHFLIQFMIII